MIIKNSKLEAVLKKAYKGAGIRIERTENFIIVRTAYMYIEADVENLTNEFKAALVKFIGEIPEPGFCKRISEDMIQEELPGTLDQAMFYKDLQDCPQLMETDFKYKDQKMLQNAKDRSIVVIPEKEWAVYCESAAEENEVETDACWREWGAYAVRRSNYMALAFIYGPADETLQKIEGEFIF